MIPYWMPNSARKELQSVHVPKELPKAEDGMKKEAVKKRRGKTRLDFTALFNGRKQREAGQKSRVPLPRRKGVWKIQAAKRSR